MPKKIIYTSILLCMASLIIAILVPHVWVKVLLGIFGGFCALLSCTLVHVYRLFSRHGGNIQEKAHDLLVNLLPWDGQGTCLDIGCGSGIISIKLAKKYPEGNFIGSDYWGETPFEYTRQQCIENAKIEGVADRITFQNANAAQLPFESDHIDAIISNLTFHEVRGFGRGERYKAFLEALRVLKKGGAFAVQDVFKSGIAFGDFDKLQEILTQHVTEIHWVYSFSTLALPHVLDHPLFLRGLGVFYGRK